MSTNTTPPPCFSPRLSCRGAYCVAFDTNVWLSHADVVRDWWGVLSRAAPRLPGTGRPALVLLMPLAVVRELDGLKLNPVHFVAARAATRLLLSEMQGSEFFRGQRCALGGGGRRHAAGWPCMSLCFPCPAVLPCRSIIAGQPLIPFIKPGP